MHTHGFGVGEPQEVCAQDLEEHLAKRRGVRLIQEHADRALQAIHETAAKARQQVSGVEIEPALTMAHRCGVYEALLFELGAELESAWPDHVRMRATWQRHMQRPLIVKQG